MMMKKKIDWDKPKKGLLNSINAISQTISRAAYEHEVAVRLQVSSPKPGRCARSEGTNKVSVRQGRGHAGALRTA